MADRKVDVLTSSDAVHFEHSSEEVQADKRV
jgi:hypothetical protein